MRIHPVGMAADRIHPMFDFDVNKSSIYEGAAISIGADVVLNDRVVIGVVVWVEVSAIKELTPMLLAVEVIDVDEFIELDETSCCFRLETSLFRIADADVVVAGPNRDLYSALSQS